MARPPVVALVGPLDTKAEEYRFVRDRLESAGVGVLVVDVGVLDVPGLQAEVDRESVALAAGRTLAELVSAADRDGAMQAMARGAAAVVSRLVAAGRVDAVLAAGGSNTAYVMGEVARAVPIGVPKVLVSTIAAGDTRPYVGGTDLTLMYPVVDVSGLNSLTTRVLAQAADACHGMLTGPALPPAAPGPVVACSMFGVTTPCVTAVQAALEDRGAEVLVFHATGVGGTSLEAMIRAGAFAAVADLTTTELVDDLVGGVCSAGPDRLTAAGACGVPQVVSVGAMDMANFGALDTVPPAFSARHLYPHNPAVTLMRTDARENAELGRRLACRVNAALGPVEVHVPLRGFSQISVSGAPFHDPVADRALVDALRSHLDPTVALHLHDTDINDPDFAAEVVLALDRLLGRSATPVPRSEGVLT